MRTIIQAALSLGFVCVLTISAPVATRAQELCIGICILDSDASASYEERARRYQNNYRYHGNYGASDYGYDRERRYSRDYGSSDYGYDRERRYSREYGYYGNYDSLANFDSYDSYAAYQRWTYYRYYYDKSVGSSTQYKGYNKAYDIR
jgi:hypothetical protein